MEAKSNPCLPDSEQVLQPIHRHVMKIVRQVRDREHLASQHRLLIVGIIDFVGLALERVGHGVEIDRYSRTALSVVAVRSRDNLHRPYYHCQWVSGDSLDAEKRRKGVGAPCRALCSNCHSTHNSIPNSDLSDSVFLLAALATDCVCDHGGHGRRWGGRRDSAGTNRHVHGIHTQLGLGMDENFEGQATFLAHT